MIPAGTREQARSARVSGREVDEFLTERGFERADVAYHEHGTFPAWAEALYVRSH